MYHDIAFRLTGEEKLEVVANCDHFAKLKFSSQAPMAFTEHGASMAASILNSPEAVAMSVFVVRAFVKMRGLLTVKSEIMKRLADMDQKLTKHHQALSLICQQLQPMFGSPPATPKRRVGFHP